ncbi:MAG: hypothetical protein J6T64_01480, partial [Bacteroidaceae bacterium]|nr:hypothetical protein [Bacteroidaceae bacterium]
KCVKNGCLIVTIVTTVKKCLKTPSFSTLFLTENAQKSEKKPHFGLGIVTTGADRAKQRTGTKQKVWQGPHGAGGAT